VRTRLLTETQFADLNELLTEFVARLSSTLGSKLVGAYLTGSFALGGGDAASDCDFLVVTDGGMSHEAEHAVRALHAEVPTWPGYWPHNLEGSYAPRDDLSTLDALGRRWLYVDRGHSDLEWSTHCNAEDVRWVLVNRPFVLAGTDPRTFACAVPAEFVRARSRALIETFLADLTAWASFEVSCTQRYAVEAAGRMLYTLERGRVISKQDALAWAAGTLPPEWRALIDQVREDRFVRWDAPPRSRSVERAVAFVEYVQERARSTR